MQQIKNPQQPENYGFVFRQLHVTRMPRTAASHHCETQTLQNPSCLVHLSAIIPNVEDDDVVTRVAMVRIGHRASSTSRPMALHQTLGVALNDLDTVLEVFLVAPCKSPPGSGTENNFCSSVPRMCCKPRIPNMHSTGILTARTSFTCNATRARRPPGRLSQRPARNSASRCERVMMVH